MVRSKIWIFCVINLVTSSTEVLSYNPAENENEYPGTVVRNNITMTLIQISRLFYFGFFSKTNHQMII